MLIIVPVKNRQAHSYTWHIVCIISWQFTKMDFNTTLQPNTEYTFQYDFYPNPQNLDVDSKYQLALSLFYENEVWMVYIQIGVGELGWRRIYFTVKIVTTRVFVRERDLNGCMDQLWFSASVVWRLLVGGGDRNCIA